MTSITLYDLLGVASAPDPEDAAAAFWPLHLVKGSIGARDELDEEEARFIVQQLNATLTFHKVRPGADANRVGLTAEVQVGAVPPAMPLVLAALPDLAFHLQPTSNAPARMAVTAGDLGTELVIEALPVEIKLPVGFLAPLAENPNDKPPPEAIQSDSFVSGQHDTLTTVLRTVEPSSIFVHIKVRMTEDGRFVLEPAVPLSFGPCRFSGLSCRGVHDLNLFPAPRLGVGPNDEAYFGDQALEWIRHPILGEGDSDYGVLTVRTVDLDETRKPFSFLRDAINPKNEERKKFEWVIEDLAFPIGRWVPLPSHFLAGIRRELGPKDDPNGAFNIGGLAIPLKGAARVLRSDYLLIEQMLFRSVAEGDFHATEGERQMAFVKLALVDDPSAAPQGPTLELAEDWTIIAGYRNDPLLSLFRLFTADFSLIGARLGLSIKRLADGDNVYEAGLLLGDIQILLSGDDEGSKGSEGVFKLKNAGEAAKGVVVNDFGLRFGSFSAGSFWKIDGAKLKAFDIVSLEIEEYGLVTELSGAVYFGFSGRIPIPLGRDGNDKDREVRTGRSDLASSRKDGVGFRFYRLRGKVFGPEEAPFVLIDGIGINVRIGDFGLTGFGSLTETVKDQHRFKEAGLSISLSLKFAKSTLDLGGAFFYGRVSGPDHNFSYGMAGIRVSPIPLTGALNLQDVRLLFAWNMAPNLGPVPAGSASAMRLFQWYEDNRNAVDLPEGRNLGLTGWKPEDDAWTVAIGAGLSISKAVTLDGFFVFVNQAEGTGLLAGLKIYLLRSVGKAGAQPPEKSNKPIGFAVFEIDGNRWSVSAGISIGTANVLGKNIPFLSDTPFLTGTFYHTNTPSTTAIGQFSDPATWLGIHIGGGVGKKHDLFTIELFAGMCLEIVDLPEGPRVFATRLSVSGGSSLFKVGGIDFYLTFQVTVGVWRTESRVSGFVGFLEGSLNIHVFYVLNFGATARVQVDYLGPDPVFRRYFFEVRIDTPWWLPDASFRWNRVTGEPAPERMDALTTPFVSAAAYQLGTPEPVTLSAISPVVGNDIRPDTLYNINDLAAASGNIPQSALAGIVPIGVDSSVSLVFNASVEDMLVFGQNTVPGVGVDTSGEVSTLYELVEFGIRRKPRGAASGWSFLIDPAISRLETLANLSPEAAEARMRQRVRMRWDADFQRGGKPDPRRLLINSDTPYLLATLNLEADEALVRNVPGWPCCPPEGEGPTWHRLDFRKVPDGTRVPTTQYFTESQSTLQWRGIRPPIAGPGQAAAGQPRVARLNADVTQSGDFARLSFDEPVRLLNLRMHWRPFHLNRTLILLVFRGLEQVEEQQFVLTQAFGGDMLLDLPEGFTEVLMALDGTPTLSTQVEFGWIEWVSARYRTVDEVVVDGLYEGRCEAGEGGDAKPGGRFAWLPNHDYEILLKTRVTVRHEGAGALVREVPQTMRFQTRGLPGLNWQKTEGVEFAPYLDSEYPRPGRSLYRDEAAMLALNEKSDIFTLPDPPRPDDPEERRQKADWALIVRRVGGSGPPERISRPGDDWIVEHRNTAPPPGPIRHPIDIKLVAKTLTRNAASLDPLWKRFELVRASPYGCNEAPEDPPSRVLSHTPYDPDSDASAEQWPARTVLRASVQLRQSAIDGPDAFVEREPFAAGDETALTVTAGAWDVQQGKIGPVADTGSILNLAAFGEASWHHIHLFALTDPAGGEAGVAMAVRGAPLGRDAVLFMVDESTRELRAIRRQSGSETTLETAALPDGLSAPYRITVTGYDDAWVASIGTAELKVDRPPADRGRPALAVRGAGRFHELHVEPLDLYSFEFETSRYADFEAHIDSWKGTPDPLPLAAPAMRSLAELLTETPVSVLMASDGDRNARQRAFDGWCADLGVLIRTEPERLEVSRSGAGGDADYLLIESPEPIPFTEDVTLALRRMDGTAIDIPFLLLSDGAERRAFLVPVDGAGAQMVLEPGPYEFTWRIDRLRYRAASSDTDQRFTQEAVSAFPLQ